VLETIWCDTESSFRQVALAPVWIVSDAGWNENPCIKTVWDPVLALGLGLDVAVIVPTFEVAAVVVALTVAVLGLGLGFEVEVHPATSSGAATRTTAIKSRYFFTFHPFFLHIGGYEARGGALNLFCRRVHLHDAKNVPFRVCAVGEIPLARDRHFWHHNVTASVHNLFREVIDRCYADGADRAAVKAVFGLRAGLHVVARG